MLSRSVTSIGPTNNVPSFDPQESSRQTAINKAMDAIQRDGVHAVKEILPSLLADLSGEKNAFHEAILTLLDDVDRYSSSSQIRQALIEQALEQQGFDLNAPDKEGRSALDLAIWHEDAGLARCLLSKGANPEQARIPPSAKMRAVLISVRWQTQLYAHHNQQGQQRWSDLDRAIRNGKHDDAQTLLDRETKGRNTRTVWLDAIRQNRCDILRGLLILRPQDMLTILARPQQPSIWQQAWTLATGAEPMPQYPSPLEKALALKDAGLSAVLKEFPYLHLKPKAPKNLNGAANFGNFQGKIVCRHLATYQQEEQAGDPHIKFNYDKFRSAREIKSNVKPDSQQKYLALKAQASEAHLIHNANFGQFLSDQFAAMEEGRNPNRLMLLESTNHAMNFGLRIKDKEGKRSYVVKFFDPNTTTNGTRSKAGSLQTFERQTMASYVETDDRLHSYFPEANGMSIIFVRSERQKDAQASTTASPSSAARRTLTTCIPIERIDSTAVWHLMASGFGGNLGQLGPRLEKLPEEQRIKLLEGKDPQGIPALFQAMQEGQGDSIRMFDSLLSFIPENRRIELIAAKRMGMPTLYGAIVHGHGDAIKAYRGMLARVPENQRIEIITFKKLDFAAAAALAMFPPLSKAIEYGYTEAVDEYCELLASVPEEERIKQISAGASALRFAMEKGHTETVKVYIRRLDLIPEQKREEIIAANASILRELTS